MCDDRERLIGYVYGECDEHEHQTIEAHVTQCATCREELSGLRAVRSDLLAWDVPEHGSVWKPFATPRPTLWRMMPAWGLAAAACAVFAVGAAGGIVTHAFLLKEPVVQAAVAPVTGDRNVQPVNASISRAEFAAFEQNMMTLLDERAGAMKASYTADDARMLNRMRELVSGAESRQKTYVTSVSNDLARSKKSTNDELEELRREMRALAASVPGGR